MLSRCVLALAVASIVMGLWCLVDVSAFNKTVAHQEAAMVVGSICSVNVSGGARHECSCDGLDVIALPLGTSETGDKLYNAPCKTGGTCTYTELSGKACGN